MASVVKNTSQAYGYKYSSLADLAEAGIEIPKMRIKPTEFGEFIEYFDGQDWQLGAKVVVPEMKSCNAAQAYGSALTYARRYTVQMAQSVACDDDKAIETQGPSKKNSQQSSAQPQNKVDFAEVRKTLAEIESVEDLEEYWRSLGKLSDNQAKFLQRDFAKRKEEINGTGQ